QPAAPSGEAVLNHPRAFGLMCTVAWTELVQALRQDGHQVNDSSGPNVRKWIESRVRDSIAAPPSATAGVAGDAVETLAERFEAMDAAGDKWVACVAASGLVRSHLAALSRQPAAPLGELVTASCLCPDGLCVGCNALKE